MAAKCPKCDYQFKLTDWRAECPKCGVNVVYYGIEDRLREEADVAEYHYAKSKPKYDRLKFSLIGHPLSIVRIAIGLLPIVALLLPMGTVSYALPFGEHNTTVNLVSIVMSIINNGLDTGLLGNAIGNEVVGKGVLFFAVALVATVMIILVSLVGWILLTLSAAPKGIVRNITMAVIGMVFATVAFVSYILMVNALTDALPGMFIGTVNPLAYIGVMVCFAAEIAVNVIYRKKNIQVKYTDVAELLIPYNERPSTIAKKKAEAKPVNA